MAASSWWAVSARMAVALARAGCEVVAVCPPGHPMRTVKCVRQVYPLKQMGAGRSLLAAIRAARPDYVLPCDDRIVAHLHELHDRQPELRALIELSIGDPCGYAATESRAALLRLATELGIRVPDTAEVASESDARSGFARLGPVAVMKLDGSFSGKGVRVVHSPEEAVQAWRRLRAFRSLATVAVRAVFWGEPFALRAGNRRTATGLTLQRFVSGTPANIMAACWRGEVLACVAVEAVSTLGGTGPATAVRLIDSPQMIQAARLLAGRLRISGFFGLDFMIEHGTGVPYLIEMNPRCTQLGHLQLAGQGDLAAILCQRLTGRTPPPADRPVRSDGIAFFPEAWRSGHWDHWYGFHQDIPWEEELLLQDMLRPGWPARRWRARVHTWLTSLVRGSASRDAPDGADTLKPAPRPGLRTGVGARADGL